MDSETNEHLWAPTLMGPFLVGHIPGVNGGTSKKIPAITLSLFELLLVAKYWAQEIIDINAAWERWGSTGSYEIRTKPYAYSRLNYLIPFIEAEIEKLCQRDPMDNRTLSALEDVRDDMLIRWYGDGGPSEEPLDDRLISRVDEVLAKHGRNPKPIKHLPPFVPEETDGQTSQ